MDGRRAKGSWTRRTLFVADLSADTASEGFDRLLRASLRSFVSDFCLRQKGRSTEISLVLPTICGFAKSEPQWLSCEAGAELINSILQCEKSLEPQGLTAIGSRVASLLSEDEMSIDSLAVIDVIWVTSGSILPNEFSHSEDAAEFWHYLRTVSKSRIGTVRLVCDKNTGTSETICCWRRRLMANVIVVDELDGNSLSEHDSEKIFCNDLMWRISVYCSPTSGVFPEKIFPAMRATLSGLPHSAPPRFDERKPQKLSFHGSDICVLKPIRGGIPPILYNGECWIIEAEAGHSSSAALIDFFARWCAGPLDVLLCRLEPSEGLNQKPLQTANSNDLSSEREERFVVLQKSVLKDKGIILAGLRFDNDRCDFASSYLLEALHFRPEMCELPTAVKCRPSAAATEQCIAKQSRSATSFNFADLDSVPYCASIRSVRKGEEWQTTSFELEEGFTSQTMDPTSIVLGESLGRSSPTLEMDTHQRAALSFQNKGQLDGLLNSPNSKGMCMWSALQESDLCGNSERESRPRKSPRLFKFSEFASPPKKGPAEQSREGDRDDGRMRKHISDDPADGLVTPSKPVAHRPSFTPNSSSDSNRCRSKSCGFLSSPSVSARSCSNQVNRSQSPVPSEPSKVTPIRKSFRHEVALCAESECRPRKLRSGRVRESLSPPLLPCHGQDSDSQPIPPVPCHLTGFSGECGLDTSLTARLPVKRSFPLLEVAGSRSSDGGVLQPIGNELAAESADLPTQLSTNSHPNNVRSKCYCWGFADALAPRIEAKWLLRAIEESVDDRSSRPISIAFAQKVRKALIDNGKGCTWIAKLKEDTVFDYTAADPERCERNFAAFEYDSDNGCMSISSSDPVGCHHEILDFRTKQLAIQHALKPNFHQYEGKDFGKDAGVAKPMRGYRHEYSSLIRVSTSEIHARLPGQRIRERPSKSKLKPTDKSAPNPAGAPSVRKGNLKVTSGARKGDVEIGKGLASARGRMFLGTIQPSTTLASPLTGANGPEPAAANQEMHSRGESGADRLAKRSARHSKKKARLVSKSETHGSNEHEGRTDLPDPVIAPSASGAAESSLGVGIISDKDRLQFMKEWVISLGLPVEEIDRKFTELEASKDLLSAQRDEAQLGPLDPQASVP